MLRDVGSIRGERELSRLGGDYNGAVRAVQAAMRAFIAAKVPLDHDVPLNRPLPTWTREHVEVVLAAAAAWNRLVATRRAYDQSLPQLRRYLAPPVGRPAPKQEPNGQRGSGR
jgi:hypothetical protein